MSMLRHWFSNKRGAEGGGGAPWTTFLSYSVKVYISIVETIKYKTEYVINAFVCAFSAVH